MAGCVAQKKFCFGLFVSVHKILTDCTEVANEVQNILHTGTKVSRIDLLKTNYKLTHSGIGVCEVGVCEETRLGVAWCLGDAVGVVLEGGNAGCFSGASIAAIMAFTSCLGTFSTCV